MLRIPVSLLLLSLSLLATTAQSQKAATKNDVVFDFGHVGVDYRVFHKYDFVNGTDAPIKISEVDAPCDCSYVVLSDSLVMPGDTASLSLTFSTKDAFGLTPKSFHVLSDHPATPDLQYFYIATVGQWYNGLKPRPVSLFFLPGKGTQKVTIPNRDFDEINISDVIAYDTSFSVNVNKNEAKRGQLLEVDVISNPNLQKGTYESNVTLKIVKSGHDKETILTIPVRIVRY